MSERELRPRRSNLAVPGSSPKMLEKAKGLPADQVFLDIEDAVAPLAKPEARKNIVSALNEGVTTARCAASGSTTSRRSGPIAT
jgi:citrate lyase subunit beta/citryl-CoA lyase